MASKDKNEDKSDRTAGSQLIPGWVYIVPAAYTLCLVYWFIAIHLFGVEFGSSLEASIKSSVEAIPILVRVNSAFGGFLVVAFLSWRKKLDFKSTDLKSSDTPVAEKAYRKWDKFDTWIYVSVVVFICAAAFSLTLVLLNQFPVITDMLFVELSVWWHWGIVVLVNALTAVLLSNLSIGDTLVDTFVYFLKRGMNAPPRT